MCPGNRRLATQLTMMVKGGHTGCDGIADFCGDQAQYQAPGGYAAQAPGDGVEMSWVGHVRVALDRTTLLGVLFLHLPATGSRLVEWAACASPSTAFWGLASMLRRDGFEMNLMCHTRVALDRTTLFRRSHFHVCRDVVKKEVCYTRIAHHTTPSGSTHVTELSIARPTAGTYSHWLTRLGAVPCGLAKREGASPWPQRWAPGACLFMTEAFPSSKSSSHFSQTRARFIVVRARRPRNTLANSEAWVSSRCMVPRARPCLSWILLHESVFRSVALADCNA